MDGLTNLFPVHIDPPLDVLYRGPRGDASDSLSTEVVARGPYLYSFAHSKFCRDRVAEEPEVVVEFLRRKLSQAIIRSNAFFDVSPHFLSASISGDLLHKEQTFSIAKRFDLQPLFNDRGYFMVV